MSNNDTFGDGFVAALFFIFFAGVAVAIGLAVSAAWIRSDCDNFGKVQIITKWYECKLIEKK